jgi:hypothetical protein
MYWPVGAPKIYAASNHGLARSTKTDNKPDDPPNASESAVDGTDDDAQSAENGDGGAKKSSRRLSKRSRRSEASARSVDLLAVKRDEHVGGEIIGVRLGRNGYMFATITRCTLTVWQTKVSRQDPFFRALTGIAHHRRGFGSALRLLDQVVRRQLRRIASSGRIHSCGANDARIPNHLFSGHRSFRASLQCLAYVCAGKLSPEGNRRETTFLRPLLRPRRRPWDKRSQH